MTTEFKAGYARRIISPPKTIYLIGYGDRLWGNRGIHDDLTATAVAIDDGKTRVVIIACDLLAINEITLEWVEKEVNANIVLCCSHTHSGPIVYADRKSVRKNKNYVEFLIAQLIEVIKEALNNLRSAVILWGTGEADIAVNRRERMSDGTIEIGVNPEGVIDRSIGIIQIQKAEGQPLVNLVNFSCHNVVLGPKNLLVSADWSGAMRSTVERETGVPCLFIQGATADLNPDHEWDGDDFVAVESLGNRVARSVLSGLTDLIPINGTGVDFIETKIWLPLEGEAKTQKPPTTYKSKLASLVGIPEFLVDPILRIRYPWKIHIENHNGFWSIPMNIVLIRIGAIVWFGMGAEVFNEIGLKIKKISQSPYPFFSSLTNGCIGYLPTAEEHQLGGYEVDLAPFSYRLPGRLQAQCEEKVTLEITSMLSQIGYRGPNI